MYRHVLPHSPHSPYKDTLLAWLNFRSSCPCAETGACAVQKRGNRMEGKLESLSRKLLPAPSSCLRLPSIRDASGSDLDRSPAPLSESRGVDRPEVHGSSTSHEKSYTALDLLGTLYFEERERRPRGHPRMIITLTMVDLTMALPRLASLAFLHPRIQRHPAAKKSGRRQQCLYYSSQSDELQTERAASASLLTEQAPARR